MADPFVAEIRIFAGNFAPLGWALCDGQLMPISQNTALFSLLGTYYGGDGRVDLRLAQPARLGTGRTGTRLGTDGPLSRRNRRGTNRHPDHVGDARHNHLGQGSTEDATLKVPGPTVYLGRSKAGTIYQSNTGSSPVQMNFQQLGLTGNSLPHQNMQPYLTLCYIIALQGVFPHRG